MAEKIIGSLDAFSALEIASLTKKLDAAAKQLLRHKEILAVIARGTIGEYQDCSLREIMDLIEDESIGSPEVSRSRTNTVIEGTSSDFEELGEKASHFDVAFRARNPRQGALVKVNLHINFEVQRDYRPGYPIEKRGMYYLARSLGSQLNVVTERTDYGQLEKCYSVWICRERIPKKEWFSMSGCKMCNYKTIGTAVMREEDYDLMELVVVRLGSSDCPEEKEELFQFLTALLYPHRKDFRERIERYIDFKDNLELKREVADMSGWGMSILEEGWREGWEKGWAEGMEEGKAEGRAEGKAEGKAESILDLLAESGSVPTEISRRIYEESDTKKLWRWLKLAACAESVEQFVEMM